MNKIKMTVLEANRLADRCERRFQRAALAWERGNNSGNNEALTHGNALCEKYRTEAEALLNPLGIVCDYPGLYPSFAVGGFTEYTVLSAISRALSEGKTCTRFNPLVNGGDYRGTICCTCGEKEEAHGRKAVAA